MKYKIGLANGDVILAEDRDCDFNKMLSASLKYVLIGDNTILLNMKHVAYIEKVGEDNGDDREAKELS